MISSSGGRGGAGYRAKLSPRAGYVQSGMFTERFAVYGPFSNDHRTFLYEEMLVLVVCSAG